MSLNVLCSLIKPTCIKRTFRRDEYERIKSTSQLVNATTLYRWYVQMGGTDTYKQFRMSVKDVLYYDKYVCEHGIEFYYHVHLQDIVYTEEMPDDVITIINAIGGYNV